MIFECFSRPKARDLSVPSDDVLLHIPGRLTAVFDGASDSLGRKIGGVSVGRLAALAAANAAANLPEDAATWPVSDLLNTLSSAVAARVSNSLDRGPASTTAVLAFEGSQSLRVVGIGDSSYRVNGRAVQTQELGPDRVSIPARVAMFQMLREKGHEVESCEVTSRRAVGHGLVRALADGVLSQDEADHVIEAAMVALDNPSADQEVIELLNNGLSQQFHLANAPDKILAYGVLNGAEPDLRFAFDEELEKASLETIEIFSDGYMSPPSEVTIRAWEAKHSEIETTDPHKIAQAPAVKGSTKTEFFDDRTILILRQA